MPYYPQLHWLINEISAWADTRQEQGFNIQPIIKRLERDLKNVRDEFDGMKLTPTMLKNEPNDLAAIQALRPKGPRRLWDILETRGLADRMKGAYLGRAAACTLGAPVESWSIEKMEALAKRCKMAFPPTDYWTDHPTLTEKRYIVSAYADYLKGNMTHIPADDDVEYTILGMLILEQYGVNFTTDDVGKAWLQYVTIAYTAEDVALKGLKAGKPALKVADKGNPYQEWIGADIRSDPWGYAAPGWPEKAAELAYRDAYLSHRQNGIYGEMFFAAAIAAAFAVDDPVEALQIGLTEIPKKCRLAKDVAWALEVGPTIKDWREARKLVDERFVGKGLDGRLREMNDTHTNNNACLTIFGLILGQKDFTKTAGITVAMGLDNDCTAATAGSLLGAVIGAQNIPAHWHKPFRNRTRTYFTGCEWFSNSDIVARFIDIAKKVWNESA